MNTIGKTLVVLNFIFAITVGIFLVLTVAVGANWKTKYDELLREARVLEANHKTNMAALSKITSDYTQAKLENEQAKQALGDKETQFSLLELDYKDKISKLDNKLLDKDLTVQESLKTQQRLADEIVGLNKTIKDRETFIVKLEVDIQAVLVQARNFESLAKARQSQNENLLDQVRDLTTKIARVEAGGNPDVDAIRNPNQPNPPAVLVNGKIEKVDDTDSTLIQLTVGTDHGVNKNNTLDVYRVRPEPKYLGMVRIVDAYPQKSVARFVFTGNAAYRPQLKVDDQVTSKITR